VEHGLPISITISITIFCTVEHPFNVGQTIGWIKMRLGTEVGLGPRHIVLDGTQLPPPTKRGTAAPPTFRFGPRLLWPNGSPPQQLLNSC